MRKKKTPEELAAEAEQEDLDDFTSKWFQSSYLLSVSFSLSLCFFLFVFFSLCIFRVIIFSYDIVYFTITKKKSAAAGSQIWNSFIFNSPQQKQLTPMKKRTKKRIWEKFSYNFHILFRLLFYRYFTFFWHHIFSSIVTHVSDSLVFFITDCYMK